jgi:hypothetical protein
MTRAIVLALAVGLGGCGGGSNGNGADGGTAACPRMGTVPADLRDVERAGEGLVSTTFGDLAGMHAASWDRAATVRSILEQVWGRTLSSCPDLPAPQVKRVNDAIATLDAAIPAMDQKSAVYAANSVGLACPELFDYFYPDAPKEVIRMDAVYRQLGIDAHFGAVAAAMSDLSSLQTDWSNAQGAVGARAPMCHRVGGTATVAGEIDTSLANVTAAFAKADTTTIETESENGALEIDTLELLFDCPADNVTPAHGIGAACTGDAMCDAGQQCDLAWGAGGGMGKCAPSATNKIGTACASTVDCGSDSRSACNTAAGDGYPGGYCFMEPCNDVEVCPPGATCVAIGGESPGCYKSCAHDGDCRVSEGYVCQLFLTTQPKGFGPTDHACAFTCTRDADCQTPLKCPNPAMAGVSKPNDPTYGKCAP